MMRSMFSGVSGLKTHQVKMDVIGNNIANVNTAGFKSSNVTFQDIMYQKTGSASAATGTRGGVNAKQIGLGVTTGATSVNITNQGAAQNTGGAFDIRLADSGSATSFFVVNDGASNVFTRTGSFYVDGAGNLAMTSTGYTVMGWQPDPNNPEVIKKDTVSALQIMKPENQTSAPEATTYAHCSGVVDSRDTDLTSKTGYAMSLQFFDNLGYSYTAKFSTRATGIDGTYTIELNDILNSNGQSVFEGIANAEEVKQNIFGKKHITGNTDNPPATYTCKLKKGWTSTINQKAEAGANATDQPEKSGTIFTDGTDSYLYDGSTFWKVNKSGDTYTNAGKATENIGLDTFFNVPTQVKDANGADTVTYNMDVSGQTVTATKTGTFYEIEFNTGTGVFKSIGDSDNSVGFDLSKLSEALGTNGNFKDISIDFSQIKMYGNGGSSNIGLSRGQYDGKTGLGKKMGNMIGLSVSENGEIYGTYDNGNKTLLGQIAVAQFANASGMEKVGENCYNTTLNSGDFDGIGVDIMTSGGKMQSGQLEMSNVDLSSEFTEMITTQRGFQANSRIITTSDTMLEELVNLKR